jgi:putative addiction module antidote
LEPLRRGKARPQALALAGAEAVARSLRCDWLDFDTAPDERVALDARFRWKWAPPLKIDRDPVVLEALAEAVAAFLVDAQADLREAALRTLGLLKAYAYREPIEACARHADPATRRAAVRALADLGDSRSAPVLMAVARDGGPAEQRQAIRALGRLRVAAAEPLLAALLDHPDREVGQAAALALGDIGGETARTRLQDLLSQPGPLRREAARALHGGVSGARPSLAERETGPPSARPGRMTEIIRGGAQPPFSIALDAALRALPALQAYDEAALSRHISQVCADWAGTRRRLVEERLMRREGGIYRFTAPGEAVWRVEQILREQYLQGVPSWRSWDVQRDLLGGHALSHSVWSVIIRVIMASKGGHVMATLKLTTVGNSVGVVLPKEILDKLHVQKGDSLYVLETPRGIELTPYDPEFARQMDVAEAVMREDRDTLRKLAG